MNIGKWVLLAISMVAVLAVGSLSRAETGRPSRDTLAEMGLGGMTVISDADAMNIRGQGFRGFGKFPRGKVAPYSRAFGSSFANIETKDGDAHTENGYFAEGPYGASGANFSEAGSEVTNIETVEIDGISKTITTTRKSYVFAGGSSSAMSF